ncbi:hypothetical protein BJV77DRAFT_364387 [Russula vinacea]|nr:hypothetical protein BJV77DRAFT_364387 [Russula vinacea]
MSRTLPSKFRHIMDRWESQQHSRLLLPKKFEATLCSISLSRPRSTLTNHDLGSVRDSQTREGRPGSPSPQSPHSVPTWSLSSRLQPSEAAFAVTSRLLESIVTESLLRAYCIILSAHVMGEVPSHSVPAPCDIFAILPLHQDPCTLECLRTWKAYLALDPPDMIPSILTFDPRSRIGYISYPSSLLSYLVPPHGSLGICCSDAEPRSTTLVEKIRLNYHDGREVNTSLAEELSSSHLWQSAAYSECNVDYFHGAYIHFCRSSI